MVKQQQITNYNITFLIENQKKIKTNYFTENYVKLTIKKTVKKSILFIFIFKNKVLKSYKNSKNTLLFYLRRMLKDYRKMFYFCQIKIEEDTAIQ